MAKCLYCYKELNEGEKDFHKACSKKIIKLGFKNIKNKVIIKL